MEVKHGQQVTESCRDELSQKGNGITRLDGLRNTEVYETSGMEEHGLGNEYGVIYG